MLVSVAVVLSTLVSVPALAASCPDPAGTPEPFTTLVVGDDTPYSRKVDPARLDPAASDAYDLVLNGGGFGHGVGMSQHGARGGAELGCNAEEILTTYYPGIDFTSVASRPITVGIHPSTPIGTGASAIELKTVGDPVTYMVDEQPVIEQAATGDRLEVSAVEGGQIQLRTFNDGGTVEVFGPYAGEVSASVTPDSRVRTIQYGAALDVMELGRGTLLLSPTPSGRVRVAVQLLDLDTYLYGLKEMPLSWPVEALKAQVIAGRSYATRSNRNATECACDILRSTSDQAYVGWEQEDPIIQGNQAFIDRWQAAVDGTSGTTLGFDRGDGNGVQTVTVFYSSSHSGRSSDPAQVFGTDPDAAPYLKSVVTDVWDDPAVSGNSLHRWSEGFTSADLAARFGWDAWTSLEVVQREVGGRPTREPPGVRVTGVNGGEVVESLFTGEEIRRVLGLRSARFYLSGDEPVPPTSKVVRVSGETRIGTAVALSGAGWPESSTHVVLARSDDPADALAGSALAGQLEAPVLLTTSDTLSPAVATELQRLGATDVWLLGGEVALGPKVATAAAQGGRTVHRLEGENRFATAVAIATQVLGAENRPQDEAARAEDDEGRTAFLVRGRDATNPTRAWADALAVSAAAASRAAAGEAWPILTTDDELPTSTAAALTDLGITTVVPVGGDVVVTAAVVAKVESLGVTVAPRLAGPDRWATSRAVLSANPAAKQRLVIATGQAFPDGLAAGPFAAHTGAGLLLVPTTFDEDASPWLDGQHPALLEGLAWQNSHVTVTGGPVAIKDAVADRVRAALLAGAS